MKRPRVLKGVMIAGVSVVVVAVAAWAAGMMNGGSSTPSGTNGVLSTPFGAPTAAEPRPGANITAVRGDRRGNWLEQTRSEVLARHGVVATSEPLAAQAGLQVLKRGGNAADAAVTTAAMLGVTEPYSAGLGGDMFVIYYSAKRRKLYGLNASGWAPESWSSARFRENGIEKIPEHGLQSVTVPGAVDGWDRLLRRFGTMRLRRVLAPAVETAEQGFGLTERIHSDWEATVPDLRQDPESTKVYLQNGTAPRLYSIFRNPDLARAYRLLQDRGRDAFYDGPIADAIVRRINRGGALPWTRDDLSDFRSEWVTPISINYKGYDVYEIPPNTQGWATLEMLNILEQCAPRLDYDLQALGPRSPRFWHILVEAKKLAYTDLHAYNGDPRFVDVPLGRLLSKQYAASLCSKIDLDRASEPTVTEPSGADTVYIAVADRWGNMASFIYSLAGDFGSQITVPGYGFPLNNRGGWGFDIDPDSPTVVAPRKRPFQTIIPAFVMKDGQPLLAFGNMGGDMQAQAQATELVNMIDVGMNVQAAGDAARFHHDQETNELDLESKLYDLVGPQLEEMGHNVDRTTGAVMGGYQAILFQRDGPHATPSNGDGTTGAPPVDGVYRAASDFRKDGQSVGW